MWPKVWSVSRLPMERAATALNCCRAERSEAVALAKQIAAKSSYVLKIGKQAFNRQAEMPLAEAYSYASEVMTENMMARDAEEGICAFIEKRKPTWEDR